MTEGSCGAPLATSSTARGPKYYDRCQMFIQLLHYSTRWQPQTYECGWTVSPTVFADRILQAAKNPSCPHLEWPRPPAPRDHISAKVVKPTHYSVTRNASMGVHPASGDHACVVKTLHLYPADIMGRELVPVLCCGCARRRSARHDSPCSQGLRK